MVDIHECIRPTVGTWGAYTRTQLGRHFWGNFWKVHAYTCHTVGQWHETRTKGLFTVFLHLSIPVLSFDQSIDTVSRPSTRLHFIHPLPRCNNEMAWSTCIRPLPPQYARATLEYLARIPCHQPGPLPKSSTPLACPPAGSTSIPLWPNA